MLKHPPELTTKSVLSPRPEMRRAVAIGEGYQAGSVVLSGGTLPLLSQAQQRGSQKNNYQKPLLFTLPFLASDFHWPSSARNQKARDHSVYAKQRQVEKWVWKIKEKYPA